MKSGELRNVEKIQIGDKLSTGSEVIGVIRKQVKQICKITKNNITCQITPSTLYWNEIEYKWQRFAETYKLIEYNEWTEYISFIVVPNSQIELENGLIVRDYLELCSPDTEQFYSKCLELRKIEYE
jgi:hypothetical protein